MGMTAIGAGLGIGLFLVATQKGLGEDSPARNAFSAVRISVLRCCASVGTQRQTAMLPGCLWRGQASNCNHHKDSSDFSGLVVMVCCPTLRCKRPAYRATLALC